jgi:carboxyl-terminal processing protease
VPGFYQDLQARSAGDPDYRSTTRDVRRLIGELQAEGGVDALVLDLRGDGGGYLPEATALTGLFIDSGPVVQLKDTDGRVEVLDDPEPGVAYAGPLAVLVDRTSASASEIFAGAIQDYKRGLLVGQTTFGKGTVQNQVRLDRWASQSTDGQINVTVGKFYRVTGESTQLRGVEPDITLPSYINAKEIGESALDHPLPWDRIAAAQFAPLIDTTQEQMLASNQVTRSQQDAGYKWMLENLSVLESSRQERSLSLNLKTRQQERAEQDRSRLERENARRIADQLPPLKSLEELKADDQPDVVLAQTTAIAADMVMIAGAERLASQHLANNQ